MEAVKYIFAFLVFPGFAFSAFMGLVIGWVDRKVTARIQWRVGPPWYQNFLDIIKLVFFKETLIPAGVPRAVFLGMPLVACTSATLVSTIVIMTNILPRSGFVGDLFGVVYLMLLPSIALMIGAFASENCLASLGASREMKLVLSYELPFILSLIVPIIRSGYAIKLGSIVIYQRLFGPLITSPSGVIAFVVMLLCVQAKLGFVPFDIPEAETEIMAGTYIEYSGKALGIFKLAKAVLMFAMPIFMITLFFGGIAGDLAGFAKNIGEYLLITAALIVIKNTNPRVRIDQAIRFFWLPVTILALAAVVLACLGM